MGRIHVFPQLLLSFCLWLMFTCRVPSQATDVGDSMVVHIYGAYFGLAVARVLYSDDVEKSEEKEGSVYHSDIFAMIGERLIIDNCLSLCSA